MTTQTWDITGMTCASCARAVEKVTGKLQGVQTASVNLASEKLTLTYDETAVNPEAVVAAVRGARSRGETPYTPRDMQRMRDKEFQGVLKEHGI